MFWDSKYRLTRSSSDEAASTAPERTGFNKLKINCPTLGYKTKRPLTQDAKIQKSNILLHKKTKKIGRSYLLCAAIRKGSKRKGGIKTLVFA